MRNKTYGLSYCFFLSVSFLFSVPLFAQVEEIEEARHLFPEAGAIRLKRSHSYKIFVENNVLKGICSIRDQVYINKESGIIFQKKAISTNKFIEASNIKAFTLIPKGNKFEKKEVEKIGFKDDVSDNVFYDDGKIYDFDFPSVQPGAILDASYQLHYIEPRFMGEFYCIDYFPSLENELVISIQKNIHIKFKLYNCDSLNMAFTREEKKNETVYRWKIKDLKAVKHYADAPNMRYFEPHIGFYVTDYVADGKTRQLLGTPKDLYTWYNSMYTNVNRTEDHQLKEITKGLVEGIESEMDRVKKIFYWVQDNISYVAFEDGFGGFVPRDAGLVCSRKYGDCKDMASIIQEMLHLAGIKAYLTIIGSRDIPYSFDEYPTPSVSNHMIASYQDKSGKWYFLDGTGDYAPLDLYTSFIQGKQAMISIRADSFLLVTVPVKDTSTSHTIDSVEVGITDKVLNGKGRIRLTGYDRLDYLYRIEHLNKEKSLDFFKAQFPKGNNKVNFSSVSALKNERTLPLSIDYNFTVPDYVRFNQNEIYINMNVDYGVIHKVEEDRKVPLSYDHKSKSRIVVTLSIPNGFKPDFIPQNISLENEIAGYSSSYSFKKGKITLTSDFYINAIMVKPADFAKYNQVLSEQLKAIKQTVSLIKIQP